MKYALNVVQFAIALMATIAFLCATPSQAQEKVTVRDSWIPSGTQAGWYWGLEKGLFKQQGLDIAYEDGNGSTTTVQLVGSGQVDVGYTDLSTMAIGRDKGMPIISVAGLIRKTSLGVFVPKGSGLKTPKDLEGKEVIYTATSFEGPFMDAFLRAGGTSREKVNLVSVDAASKIQTYVNGRGQGMVTSIPYGAPLVNAKRPSDTILFADYGLVLPSYGLVVRTDTLKRRRATIEKVVNAFRLSWQQIIDGGEKTAAEAADIVIKRRPDAKIDRDQTIKMILAYVPYFYTPNTRGKPLGWQSQKDWKATIRALQEAKLIKPGSKPGDYYTNALIKAH